MREMTAVFQQQRGPAPAGPQPQPQLPPGYGFDPYGRVVPVTTPQPVAINDPELRQFADQMRTEFQQQLAPLQQVGQTNQEILGLMQQQRQSEIQRQGQLAFAQIVQQHPIFSDPDLGEDAVTRLSVRFQTEGRFRSLPELAQEVATAFQQKQSNLLQRAATAAAVPLAPGAGASVPPGGQGPVLQNQPPRDLRESSIQARNAPVRALPGQA